MIFITDIAQDKLREILKDTPTDHGFVIEVLGGGCSGFKYDFTVKPLPEKADIIRFQGGVVAVDELSIPLLDGATLDWENSLMQSRPIMRNPQSVSSCGCGVSFAI